MKKINQIPPRRYKREQQLKWRKRCIIGMLIILIGCGAYAMNNLYGSLFQGLDLHSKKSKLRDEQIQIQKDPFAILLIGEDGRSPSGTNWRPDILMVATINPKTNSIKRISIPRDTYTEIAHTHGFKTKINAAAHYGYANGIDPVQNIRETVENLLNIPIDYYVKVNFNGFVRAVDLLNGVDVNVAFPFKEMMIGGKMASFSRGPMHLTGPQALAYVRMRKKDPHGDHGRNKRQQEVLSQLLDKLNSFGGLTKLTELTQVLGENVTYSIPLNLIPSLSTLYSQSKNNQESLILATTPSRKHGICYEILAESERRRVSKALQSHLEFMPNTPSSNT